MKKETISLEDVIKNNMSYKKRKEKKLIWNIGKLKIIHGLLIKNWFKLVESNWKTDLKYKNFYFDTKDFWLYNWILNKKFNLKVRIREYENWDKFLETKLKKFNWKESLTFKKRKVIEKNKDSFNLKEENLQFINEYIKSDNLLKVFFNEYKRKTYINIEKNSRVTIDFDIKTFNNKNSKEFNVTFKAWLHKYDTEKNNFIILETKELWTSEIYDRLADKILFKLNKWKFVSSMDSLNKDK